MMKEKKSKTIFTQEAASIKKGLYLTDKQMQELKFKAREEFEKQTASYEDHRSIGA